MTGNNRKPLASDTSQDSPSRLSQFYKIAIAGIQANVWLAIYKTLFVYVSQPVQTTLRVQQSGPSMVPPQFLSERQAVKIIYDTGLAKKINISGMPPNFNRFVGITSAFYKGVGPGATKEFLKNLIYKGWLIKKTPNAVNSFLQSFGLKDTLTPLKYNFVKAVFSTPIATFIDFALGTPLERIAIFRSTSQGHHAQDKFSKEFKSQKGLINKMKFLYDGSSAVIVKGHLQFFPYFFVDPLAQKWVRTKFHVMDNDDLPWYASFTSAAITSGSVALISTPADMLKTQLQMAGRAKRSMMGTLFYNHETLGLKAFSTGYRLKLLMVFLGWFLTNLALDDKKKHGQEKEEPLARPRLGR